MELDFTEPVVQEQAPVPLTEKEIAQKVARCMRAIEEAEYLDDRVEVMRRFLRQAVNRGWIAND